MPPNRSASEPCRSEPLGLVAVAAHAGSRRPASPRTASRLALSVAGLGLALASTVALAQSGPVGRPSGQPTQAYGASAGSQGDNRGGYRAPTSNWSSSSSRSYVSPEQQRAAGGWGSSDSDRNSYQAAPAPVAPQPQTSTSTRGTRGAPATAIDRRIVQSHDSAVAATRTLREDDVDSIDHLQQLVQQGTMHETGLGAQRDLTRAFDLYCEAAAQGFPEALVRMAWMYADGNGVEKSRAAAHTLFLRAKRFGYANAGELAARYAGEPEVLPVCLRGTIVERGNIERPPTREEMLAFGARATSTTRVASANLSGDRSRFAQIVLTEARRFKVDPRLVMAVMSAESGFDPNARSLKNAHGLMQLLPETAERFNVANIDDPAENIRGGMAYLRWLLAYFRGDVALALAGYNAGEGAVDKHGGVPPYPETLAYVQRIRAAYPFDRHPYDPTAASAPSRTAQAPKSNAASAPAMAFDSHTPATSN